MGKRDAPCGTFDHLALVMGRIADFAARDQRRKRKAAEANGGQWRPPPGMKLGPPPGANPPAGQAVRGQAAAQAPPQAPTFFGMIPNGRPSHIPTAFVDPRGLSPASSAEDELELEAATTEAEDEWKAIKQALQLFEESTGPDYQPLPPDRVRPVSTPFGPAVYYKTSSIAVIWSLYHMAQIILHRAHPDMPAAAMMAAGVAAGQTARFANEVGRVTAGVFPLMPGPSVTPPLGGALIEATLPLFFAGVQYQDPAQRGWTVSKLQEIARLTGWESSVAIAAGCETSWEKAGLAGRGPPYTRTLNPLAHDDRMAGRRRDDSRPPKDNTDRRLVTVNAGTRVHWAVGILGVEEDLENLGLEENRHL
ncbi:MAG: hypothetical protein M1832_001093 [Thelocarpon impressellum]|nr:MAG: hypothetical protein M1832_001093 [Thelocarpon impressellum]